MDGYRIEVDPCAKGPCLGCGIEVLGSGFVLRHPDGESLSPYCSRSCADQDAEADVLGSDFDPDEGDGAIDEPR